MQNINLMSGGEKAMTAVSLIFLPFSGLHRFVCSMRLITLDDANVTRFNEMLRDEQAGCSYYT
jgi:chromosome segregation protein